MTDNGSETMEIKSDTTADDEYATLNLAAGDTFPGVSEEGEICVKISGDGSVVKEDDKKKCQGKISLFFPYYFY